MKSRSPVTDCPSVQLQLFPIEGFRRALAFIPHPDDEVLGCGGLLYGLVGAGCEVDVVLVSDGSGGPGHPENLTAARLSEFAQSLRILGVHTHEAWLLPDGQLEGVVGLNARIDARVAACAPDLILAPWPCDLHPDHAVIGASVQASAAAAACSVAWYEVWSPLPASHVLDITALIETKKQALREHATALRYGNYLEAMMGLAAYRGINLPFQGAPRYAEAYLLRSPTRRSA